jgi:hypothetical protein
MTLSGTPMPDARRTRLLLLAIPMLAVAGLALAFVLLRDGDDGGPGEAQGGAPRLVFAEFGQTADVIYAAPAETPAERVAVAAVEHAPGWALTPAREMAGSLVAYVVLPADARPQRDSPAELWVLDVSTGAATRLARDADLLVAPVLSDDGAQIVYRSSDPNGRTQSLVRIDVASRTRRAIHELDTTFGVLPVGFAADGSLVFVELSTAGTDIYLLPEGGEPALLVHASDEVARDWRLSPDRRTLSYLAPETQAERIVHRLHAVELPPAGEQASELTSIQDVHGDGAPLPEQFSPVWTPDGAGVTVGIEAYPGIAATATTIALADGSRAGLAGPQQGFDAPLGWSPDGRYLAARSFDGVDAYEPGNESLVLISTDGGRAAVPGERELIFMGWFVDA